MTDDDFMPPPEFYREMARYCRCCTGCSNPPCDGVCAGGVCDQACSCDDEFDDWRDDEFDDWRDDEEEGR